MTEPVEYTVMLHGFINLDCNNDPCRHSGLIMFSQEHWDYDLDGADGWNVWLRRDYPMRGTDTPQEPFDSHPDYDADFASVDAAMMYAEALAERFDCEIDAY